MGRTRLELSGIVVKQPMLGVTPGGRAVLRVGVDCGEAPDHLLLDVVLVDEAARELARVLKPGRHIRAAGKLMASGRKNLVGAGRHQVQVIADRLLPNRLRQTDRI
jgi:hypothetical protein